jgi:hypothetical protein
LTQQEIDRLISWSKELKWTPDDESTEFPGGAGENGRYYSTERYKLFEGYLLEPDEEENPDGLSSHLPL